MNLDGVLAIVISFMFFNITYCYIAYISVAKHQKISVMKIPAALLTEKQRGARKSDIMSALPDIRGAMLASEATNKYCLFRCYNSMCFISFSSQFQILVPEFFWPWWSRGS